MSRGRRSLLGAAMVATAAALWGFWSLVIRPSGLTTPHVAVTVMAVLALPAPRALLRRPAFRDRGAVVALAALGGADAANIALYFAAISRGPIAVAVLTHYLAPVFVTLLAPLVAREPLSRRTLLAAPASLIALGLVLGRPAEAPLATAALGAASAVFYVVIVFAARRAGRTFAPDAVTSLHALVALVLLVAVFGRAAIPPWAPGTAVVAAGALVCGILASVLFFAGVTRIPAAVAAALTYLEPVVAALVGYGAFGERLGPLAIGGAAVVVACGAWVALEPARPAEAAAPARAVTAPRA